MAFTDHKITQFEHRIADLADQPNLPPDELKARFDSSPEELRQSVNAICDEGDALSARVDHHDTQINQIAMDKFPDDTIQEKNLHPDLAAKLNAKADETALSAAVNTLEAADAVETAAREALSETVAQKCEIFLGSYTGNFNGFDQIPQDAEDPMSHITSWQNISLGFRPRAVLIFGYEGTAVSIDRLNHNAKGGILLDSITYGYNGTIGGEIIDNGFRICCSKFGNTENYAMLNTENETYRYMAIK